MATTKTTTTKVLRHHMALRNGGTRYIDVDNPIEDQTEIAINIRDLNTAIDASYSGILVGNDYFDGDSDAVVTRVTSAEIIETQKTVTTTDITLST